MKILKYNENSNTIWNEEKFNEFQILKDSYLTKFENIKNITEEYVKLNPEKSGNEYCREIIEDNNFYISDFDYYKYSSYISENKKAKIIITVVDIYDEDSKFNFIIYEDNFQDFLNFINNPEIYKKTKNYNI